MSVGVCIVLDKQLVRLLQIGVVLEEIVEARTDEYYRTSATPAKLEADPKDRLVENETDINK